MAKLTKGQRQVLQRQINHLGRVADQLDKLRYDLLNSGRPVAECGEVGWQVVQLERIIAALQGVGERLGPEPEVRP